MPHTMGHITEKERIKERKQTVYKQDLFEIHKIKYFNTKNIKNRPLKYAV